MSKQENIPTSQQKVLVVERGGQAVYWVIAMLLAVIATVQILKWDEGGIAYGQNVARAGAGGVFAFSGQVTPRSYGVFMVDVDSGVICAYEIEPGTPKKLRLIAARTWLNDRYLEEYNVSEPTPKMVEALVAKERARRLEAQGLSESNTGAPKGE